MEHYQINLDSLTQGFTQSEISTMSNCGRKWFWGYNLMLEPRGAFSWALVVGDAFHAAMEELYATAGQRYSIKPFAYPPNTILSPDDYTTEEYWRGMLDSMIQAYIVSYKNDFTEFKIEFIEEELDFIYEGIRLRGKLDLGFRYDDRGKIFVMDHKTTSRLDLATISGWDFRFQFMFYLWGIWKSGKIEEGDLGGFTINAIKKPELRIKKASAETVPNFLQRCKLDMIQEPEKYFYREDLPITKGAMMQFENEVLRPKMNRLKLLVDRTKTPSDSPFQMARDAIALDMNTDYCQQYGKPCEFLNLCRFGRGSGFDNEYDVRETKHRELV